MHLVPQNEVLEKLAAIQSADVLGRQIAQDRAIEKLASMAGVFMAHAHDEEGIDKLAQSMVRAGQLSFDEYEMLKEAGWLGAVAKRVGRGIKAKVTGVKSGVGKVLKRPPKSMATPRQSRDWAATPRPKARPRPPAPVQPAGQSRDWAGRSAPRKVAPKPTPQPSVPVQSARQSRDWAGQSAPGRVAPRQQAPVPSHLQAQSRDWSASAARPAAAPGVVSRAASGVKQRVSAAKSRAGEALNIRPAAVREGRVVKRVRGAERRPQRAPITVETRGQPGTRTLDAPGRVAPTTQATAMREGRVVKRTRDTAKRTQQAPIVETRGQRGAGTPDVPGQVAPRSAPTQQSASKTAPAAGTAAQKAGTSAGQQAATSSGKQPAAKNKGVSWGRAAPYAAAGGLGYGLYKGVPWAARQLEQTSTTPMAYGAGWSPVSYGYGRSQYGPHTATMGAGA